MSLTPHNLRAAKPTFRMKLEVHKDGMQIEALDVGGKGCVVLGRNEDMSDHVLAHPTVSRQHAAILHNADGESFVRVSFVCLFVFA